MCKREKKKRKKTREFQEKLQKNHVLNNNVLNEAQKLGIPVFLVFCTG